MGGATERSGLDRHYHRCRRTGVRWLKVALALRLWGLCSGVGRAASSAGLAGRRRRRFPASAAPNSAPPAWPAAAPPSRASGARSGRRSRSRSRKNEEGNGAGRKEFRRLPLGRTVPFRSTAPLRSRLGRNKAPASTLSHRMVPTGGVRKTTGFRTRPSPTPVASQNAALVPFPG